MNALVKVGDWAILRGARATSFPAIPMLVTGIDTDSRAHLCWHDVHCSIQTAIIPVELLEPNARQMGPR